MPQAPPSPPPGFTLDPPETRAEAVPPPPPGFTLDQPSPAPKPPAGFVLDTPASAPTPPAGFVLDAPAPQPAAPSPVDPMADRPVLELTDQQIAAAGDSAGAFGAGVPLDRAWADAAAAGQRERDEQRLGAEFTEQTGRTPGEAESAGYFANVPPELEAHGKAGARIVPSAAINVVEGAGLVTAGAFGTDQDVQDVREGAQRLRGGLDEIIPPPQGSPIASGTEMVGTELAESVAIGGPMLKGATKVGGQIGKRAVAAAGAGQKAQKVGQAIGAVGAGDLLLGGAAQVPEAAQQGSVAPIVEGAVAPYRDLGIAAFMTATGRADEVTTEQWINASFGVLASGLNAVQVRQFLKSVPAGQRQAVQEAAEQANQTDLVAAMREEWGSTRNRAMREPGFRAMERQAKGEAALEALESQTPGQQLDDLLRTPDPAPPPRPQPELGSSRLNIPESAAVAADTPPLPKGAVLDTPAQDAAQAAAQAAQEPPRAKARPEAETAPVAAAEPTPTPRQEPADAPQAKQTTTPPETPEARPVRAAEGDAKPQTTPVARDMPPAREDAVVARADAGEPPGAPTKIRREADEPSPERTFSNRKVDLNRDRAKFSRGQLDSPDRRRWESLREEAMTKHTPESTDDMLREVAGKGRQMTDLEVAATDVRLVELSNEYDDLVRRAGQTDDAAQLTHLRAEMERLEDLHDFTTATSAMSGTESARALAARRMTLNDQMDMVAVLNRAKARKGRPLTPKERGTFERRIKELEAKNLEVETALRKSREDQARRVLRRQRQPRQPRQPRKAKGADAPSKTAKARPADESLDSLIAKANELMRRGCR